MVQRALGCVRNASGIDRGPPIADSSIRPCWLRDWLVATFPGEYAPVLTCKIHNVPLLHRLCDGDSSHSVGCCSDAV